MSEDQLSLFLQTVSADSALQDKLKEITDVNAVVEFAKGLGFAVSAGELEQLTAEYELSDAELEEVSGGTYTPAFAVTVPVGLAIVGAEIGAAIYLGNKYGNGNSGG
jgi:predicted ribosomally synthesized peptide with nif11-like leader